MEKTFSATELNNQVPKEQQSKLFIGLLFHLGPAVLFVFLLSYFGMSIWNVIAFFLLSTFLFFLPIIMYERYDPTVKMEKPNFREFINGISVVFFKGILVGGSFVSLGWYLVSRVSPISGTNNGWLAILSAVFLTDLFYYFIHRFLSHGTGNHSITRFYRKAHVAHHSVSEMDFIRGNQSSLIDTAISQFQPSLILISAFLGMDLPSTLTAYGLVLMLQSTDHINFTCNIGWLKYVFMDNHAHRFHHCKKGNWVNHGAVFSIYDRIFGTYYEDWDISSGYMHHHRIVLPIKIKRFTLFPSSTTKNNKHN